MIESTFTRVRSGLAVLGGALLLSLSACDKPVAIGNANEILVVSPQPVWDELEEEIRNSLEPRTFTVRNESVFDVAHVTPDDSRWDVLSVNRQILLIGSPGDARVVEALEEYSGPAPSPPTIVQVRNVWAQNQLVTILLLAPGASPDAARPLLAQLGELYLRQYQEYAHARMFVTSANQALADSLRRNAGFSLTLPQVYRYQEVEPGVFVFRNDQPDPSRLIRNITVDSRPRSEVQITPETAREWRADLALRLTQPPQQTQQIEDSLTVELPGGGGIQIQGVWSNPPGGLPAGGPFITQLVACPDRVFLVDAWLYAPGIPKYEYMYQLQTIMQSFECAEASGG